MSERAAAEMEPRTVTQVHWTRALPSSMVGRTASRTDVYANASIEKRGEPKMMERDILSRTDILLQYLQRSQDPNTIPLQGRLT